MPAVKARTCRTQSGAQVRQEAPAPAVGASDSKSASGRMQEGLFHPLCTQPAPRAPGQPPVRLALNPYFL